MKPIRINKYKYMYIDESGDLGMNYNSSKFLILSALIVDDSSELDRIIKNMRRNKFRKELRKASEIKANKSPDYLIVYMLKKLNSVSGAKLHFIVLEKKKLSSEYLMNDKHKLYNYVAGKLAQNILFDENSNIEIKIDKSKGSQLLRSDFNMYFEKRLLVGCKDIKCKIEHSFSHSWSGLQFADILSWACYQKFENNDSRFVDLIDIETEIYHVW